MHPREITSSHKRAEEKTAKIPQSIHVPGGTTGGTPFGSGRPQLEGLKHPPVPT
jgi:hypothetical protein